VFDQRVKTLDKLEAALRAIDKVTEKKLEEKTK
jgi:hypothetical protein